MTKRGILLFVSLLLVLGTAVLASAQAKPPADDSWTMKMRVYEVPGKGSGTPVKSVTSSYLNYKLTATIKTEYDLAEEMKQIQKTFNYADVKLLTEADFAWKRNDRERAFHIFRLDGHEYVVLITPIDGSKSSSRAKNQRSTYLIRNSPSPRRISLSSASKIRRAAFIFCPSALRAGPRHSRV